MRLLPFVVFAALLSMACSSGGSNDSDTQPAAEVVADPGTDPGTDPGQPDLPPDPGQDLGVIEVVTDTAVDPGQPDTAVDTVQHYATCSDLFFQCVSKCDDEGDMTCENACIGNAEPAAAAAMATLGTCVSGKCADMAAAVDWIECLGNSTDRCGAEFTACVGGEDICKDVRTCWLTSCPKGEWDHGCAIACMASGSADAKARFAAFYSCVFEVCGTAGDFDACYMAKSGNECANQNSFCDNM